MNPSPGLQFSWRAFLLAPWPVAIVVGGLLTPRGPQGFSWGAYAFLLGLVLAIAYAGTIALAACVWLVGRARPVSLPTCGFLGLLLAGVGYAPLLWISWSSSGPDSGPPVETFAAYVLRDLGSPILYLFLGAGVVTAMLYALAARRFTAAAGQAGGGRADQREGR